MLKTATSSNFPEWFDFLPALVIIISKVKYKISWIVNLKAYKLLYKIIWLGYKDTKDKSK